MRRHALASAALILVGAVAAIQLPHGNFLRNSLHEKQAGVRREAEHSASLSDDGAVTPLPTGGGKPRTTREAGQAGPATNAAPAPPKAAASPPPSQDEDENEDDDYKRRTLVVTRETSVYLPGPSAASRSTPRPAGAGPRRGASPAAPTAPPSPPANILNTLKRFGFVVGFARWTVQKPGVAAWWLSRNGAGLAWDLTWRTTTWSIRNSKAAASWTWEWIIIPCAAPFLIPLELFVIVPGKAFLSVLIALRPLILLIWSACLVGVFLGVMGGFGSSVVGDWVYRRSELLVLRSAEAAPNGVEPGFGSGYGQGALEYTARKGMTWAEKPASAWDDESDGSDGGGGREGGGDDQWPDPSSPTTEMSPAYAGRPSSGRSGGNGSYSSSRQGPGTARRRSTAESVSSMGPESPMERKGSLSSGKSPRPGLPKKKVTFDGAVEEKS